MSRLWTEPVEILLAPAVAVARAGRRSGGGRSACAPAGEGDWTAVLGTLPDLLERLDCAGARVTLVLSNHFVRYAVLPWQPDLAAASEQEAFARHLFAETFGADGREWAIRVSPQRSGLPRLASAVDAALLAAAGGVLQDAGMRPASVQPLWMHAFNRWRREPGMADAWFAVAEPGRLCLGLVCAGAWRTIAASRMDAGLDGALPALLRLERARAATLGHEAPTLFVCAPFGETVPAPRLAGVGVRMLGGQFDPDRAAATGTQAART